MSPLISPPRVLVLIIVALDRQDLGYREEFQAGLGGLNLDETGG